jgi:orotate phosphoribosyltransferase
MRERLRDRHNIETTEEDDRLLASQFAARLLEHYLNPQAVTDKEVISSLVLPYGNGKFLTNLTMDEMIEMFVNSGALHHGHFELLSGLHSEYFFMFGKLGAHKPYRKRIAQELAQRFEKQDVDTVIAPVTAGGLLVPELASLLGAQVAFFEIDDHSRAVDVRPGYNVAQQRVLVVNDMTTTGIGLSYMLEILRNKGANPVGVGLVAVRGAEGVEAVTTVQKQGYKVDALLHLNIPAVKAPCALCNTGRPVVTSHGINR